MSSLVPIIATHYFDFYNRKMGHSMKKGGKYGAHGATAPYMGRPIKKGAKLETCIITWRAKHGA